MFHKSTELVMINTHQDIQHLRRYFPFLILFYKHLTPLESATINESRPPVCMEQAGGRLNPTSQFYFPLSLKHES